MGIYETCANAVGTHLESVLDGSLSLPVAYDNAPFATPSPDLPSVSWAGASIEFDGEEQVGFRASNRYQIRGAAVIEFKSTVATGDAAALSLASSAKSLFRDVFVDPVQFEDPYHVTLGREGAWHVVELRCPFRAEHEQSPTLTSTANPPLTTVHNVIRGRLNTLVTVPQSITTNFDNAPGFVPPTSAPWMRANVLTGTISSTDHATLRTRRQPGLLKVIVSVPLNTGTQMSWRIADYVADAFRAVAVGGVRFLVPSARAIGRQGAYWAVVVDCPFRFDERA